MRSKATITTPVIRMVCVLLAAGLASCASSAVTPSSPAGSAPVPVVSEDAGEAWVAVLATAADPSDLSEERKATLADLGDALAGYVIVSPVSCLHGLPADMPAGDYALAIQQDTRVEVRALAGQLPDAPSFIGPVHVVCTD